MDAVEVSGEATVSGSAVSWRPGAAGRLADAGSNAGSRGRGGDGDRGAVAKTSESDEKSALSEYPSVPSKLSGPSFILSEGLWGVAFEDGCGRMANGLEMARSNEPSTVVPKTGCAPVWSIRDSTTFRKKNEVPAGDRMRRRSIIERGK